MKKGIFSLFLILIFCGIVFGKATKKWEKTISLSPPLKIYLSPNENIYLISSRGIEAFSKTGEKIFLYKPKNGHCSLFPVFDLNSNLYITVENLKSGNYLIVLDKSGKVKLTKKIKNARILGSSKKGDTVFLAKDGNWASFQNGDILVNQKIVAFNPAKYLKKGEVAWTFFRKNGGIDWVLGLENGISVVLMRDINTGNPQVLLLSESGTVLKTLSLKSTDKKPLLADNLLVFINMNPKTYNYRLSAYDLTTFKKKWDIPTGDGNLNPVYANGKIYFTTRSGGNNFFPGTLFIVSKEGKILKRLNRPMDIMAMKKEPLTFAGTPAILKNGIAFLTYHQLWLLKNNSVFETLVSNAYNGEIAGKGDSIYYYHSDRGKPVLTAYKVE